MSPTERRGSHASSRSVSLRSRFVSFQRKALRAVFLLAVVLMSSSASAQTSYTAVLDGSLPVTDVSPVSVSGGDASVGGFEDADAVLKGEAHAAAAAPNALVSVFKEFGGQALDTMTTSSFRVPSGQLRSSCICRFRRISTRIGSNLAMASMCSPAA